MEKNSTYNSFPQNLTGIPLPTDKYVRLLGTSMSVFAYNNGLVIENLVNSNPKYNWYDLTDKESGQLKKAVSMVMGPEIGNMFSNVVDMRNRIIHSFRVTSKGNQILATKDRKTQDQFDITEEYMYEFIKKNNELCYMLTDFRGY